MTLKVEGDYPLLGRVENMFVANCNTIYFHVRLINTLHVNIYRHFYVVELTPNYKTVSLSSSLYCAFPFTCKELELVDQLIQVFIPQHHILNTLQQ